MSRMLVGGLAGVLTLVASLPAQAQCNFREQQAQTILTDAVRTGANIFDRGDWSGCYYVYRGAMLSIRPLLNTRPELRARMWQALQQSNRDASYYDKAWRLRRSIDQALYELSH